MAMHFKKGEARGVLVDSTTQRGSGLQNIIAHVLELTSIPFRFISHLLQLDPVD